MRAILPTVSLLEAIDPSLKAPPACVPTEAPTADAFLQMVAALAAPVEPIRAAPFEAAAATPQARPDALAGALPEALAGASAEVPPPASQLAPCLAADDDSEADSSSDLLGAGLIAWLAAPLPAPAPAKRTKAEPAVAGAAMARPTAETWIRLNAAAPVVAAPAAPQPEAAVVTPAAAAPAARGEFFTEPPAAERPTPDANIAEAPISRAPAAATQPPLPILAAQPVLAEAASFHPAAEPTLEAAEPTRPGHQLEIDDTGVWIDRLARDLASLADGRSSLRFRLHPESLGSLAVEISQGDSGVAVRLTADTESARAILADAQPRLVLEARAHGVRLTETHIDTARDPGSGSAGTGPQSQHGEDRGHRGRAQEPARTASSETKYSNAPEPVNPAARGSERYA